MSLSEAPAAAVVKIIIIMVVIIICECFRPLKVGMRRDRVANELYPPYLLAKRYQMAYFCFDMVGDPPPNAKTKLYAN